MNALFFFVLSVVVSSVVPLLVMLVRPVLRPVLLYVYLGVVLTVGGLLGQVYAVPVTAAIVLSGGSIAFGAFMLAAVVLVIVTQDASAARRVAYLVVGVNVVNLTVFAMSRQALEQPWVRNPFDLSAAFFTSSIRLVLVGGVLIIAELLLLVVLLERAKPHLRGPTSFTAVAVAGYVAVVTLDGVLFPVLGLTFEPGLIAIISGGVRSKLVLALAYAVPFTVFLALFREHVERFRTTPLLMQQLVVAPRGHLVEQIEVQATVLARVETARDRLQVDLSELGEAVIDGLVAVADDGVVTSVNEAAVDLLGVAVTDAVGQPFVAAYPDLRPLLEPNGAKESRSVTVVAGGKPVWRTVEARTRLAAGVTLVFVRDVTMEARNAAQVEAARAAELAAAERIIDLDRTRSAIVSATSHELRTPLTVLAGALTTLTHRKGLAEADKTALIAAMSGQVDRLRALLDDLLDIGRIGEQPVQRRGPFDVVALVAEEAERVAGRVAVTIAGPDALAVHLDRSRVLRIVRSLLTNVDKYAGVGEAEIRIARLAERGVRLDVIDLGVGIPSTERERVFEPFTRLDLGHASPGTGIGLSLVRQFARDAGGGARIVSSERGLHALVELPGTARP